MLKNQRPVPCRFQSPAAHGLWCNSLHPEPMSKPQSSCLICLFNQHVNKNMFSSKETTSRNNTPIKPKLHKKLETDRLIVDFPHRWWTLSPEKLAKYKNHCLYFAFQSCFMCFCVQLSKCLSHFYEWHMGQKYIGYWFTHQLTPRSLLLVVCRVKAGTNDN